MTRCSLRDSFQYTQPVLVRNRSRILAANLRDPEADGAFAIVDADLVVTSFGFSVKSSWGSDRVITQLLLPVDLNSGLNQLVFVEEDNGAVGKHRLCGTL